MEQIGLEPLKIVVIDDDPTGSQTVHGCPLLLRWDRASLEAGLRHPSPLLFVLANTRALGATAAAARLREICRSLEPALKAAGVTHWLVVSRGDSTLRGHFPLEREVLSTELGPFDATLLVPAFLEGGRTTQAGVHQLNGRPVHESAFAQDRLFGYTTSFLPDWVAEKSGGRLPASSVQQLEGELLTAAASGPPGQARLRQRLAAFRDNVCVAVDGERPEQLAALGQAIRELTAPHQPEGDRPRRFLCQSAASLIQGLAALPPQALPPNGLARLRRRNGAGSLLPGLVLVGSHVPLADQQLAGLLADPACAAVELEVDTIARLLAASAPERPLAELGQQLTHHLAALLATGRTAVLHTSRGEHPEPEAAARRRLGLTLAGLMARVAAALAPQLGYLISKGGITTHTLLAEGLELTAVELQGQLLPGLSLVLAPLPTATALPVLTFPGNLGEASTLAQAWRLMEGHNQGGEEGDGGRAGAP